MVEKIISMDVKLIAALVGIFGVLLTALLTSLGYFLKTRVETKRSARKVLYFLLEIRFVILSSLFDPEQATNSYFEHFCKKFREKGFPMESSEVESSMRDIVHSHFQNIVSAMRTDIHEKLLPPFEDSLLEFSAVKPVLAYRLKGKEKIEEVMVHTNNYRKNYEERISSDIDQKWLVEILCSSSEDIKEESVSEIIKSLDEDIILLAKHCGVFNYIECKRVLSKKGASPSRYNFEGLDEVVDKIFIKVIEAANKSREQSVSVVEG